MKKTGKLSIAFVLTVSMLLSYAMPLFTLGVLADDEAGQTLISELSAEIIADGICGDTLTWTLESDGTLTISGEGSMTEMSDAASTPWYDYREEITSIIVESGVTSISDYAFAGCTNAVIVKIHPDTDNSGENNTENAAVYTNESIISDYYYPSMADSMIVMSDRYIDIDTNWTNLTSNVYSNGVRTHVLIEEIDGKVIADLSIKALADLMSKDELFYPGLIYLTAQNDEGEYTVLGEAFDPYDVTDREEFGLVDASCAQNGTTVSFSDGVSTNDDDSNNIFTHDGTVFYFIDRTENGKLDGTNMYAEGSKTTVATYIGSPSNMDINLGTEGMIFVDNLGVDAYDFANVVIVYEAAEVNISGEYDDSGYEIADSIVYVPTVPARVTVSGTPTALGLNATKYTEGKYYKYANAALDLDTGSTVDIITSEILDANNTNAIYELDSNSVVIARNGKNYKTFDDAVTFGVLAKVKDAVLSYKSFGGGSYAVLHNADESEVAIGINSEIAFLIAFPVGGDLAVADNFIYNDAVNETATTPALINGDKNAYFLASGLADGSAVVLYDTYTEDEDSETGSQPDDIQYDISIGNSAFEGCSNLLAADMYTTDISVGEDAFSGVHPYFVIRGYSDSLVELYALENGCTFVPLDLLNSTPIAISPDAVTITLVEDSSEDGKHIFCVTSEDTCMILVSYDAGKSFVRIPVQKNENREYRFAIDDVSEDVIIVAAAIGDMNNDGVITNADFTKLKAANFGKIEYDLLQKYTSDVNGDGKVSNADLTRLKAALLGKIKLPW